MNVTEKDLMLGNWITVVEKNGRRTNVEVSYLSNPEGDEGGEANDEYVDHFEAIPLTTEILLKNGFKESEDEVHENERFYTITVDGIKFSLKYARNVFQWIHPLDFSYVHELQNALKLSGIKMKFKLD